MSYHSIDVRVWALVTDFLGASTSIIVGLRSISPYFVAGPDKLNQDRRNGSPGAGDRFGSLSEVLAKLQLRTGRPGWGTGSVTLRLSNKHSKLQVSSFQTPPSPDAPFGSGDIPRHPALFSRGGCLPGYLKAVWPDFLGCVFEVWPAPGARESPPKCGGRSPSTF